MSGRQSINSPDPPAVRRLTASVAALTLAAGGGGDGGGAAAKSTATDDATGANTTIEPPPDAHAPPPPAPADSGVTFFLGIFLALFAVGIVGFVIGLLAPVPLSAMMYSGLASFLIAYLIQRLTIDVFCNPPTLANASLKFVLGTVMGICLTLGLTLMIGAIVREGGLRVLALWSARTATATAAASKR